MKHLTIAVSAAALLLALPPAHATDFKDWLPLRTTASTPGASDYLPLVQGGVTKKLPGDTYLNRIGLAAGAEALLNSGTSAALRTFLSDETGIGAAVFANSPVLVSPNLGIISAGDLTNATNVPMAAALGILGQTHGGTGTAVAGGAALDNISAFASTGFIQRTGAGAYSFATSSGILDLIGSTRGSVLYRGAAGWAILAPGTNGQALTTAGAGADPSWTTITGTGTVTSVGAAAPGGGVFSFTGGPVTGAGTLTLAAAGTSGGIPYFSSATQIASSAALTANAPVIGGGAGTAPTVGTRSGNTTAFATVSGALTVGHAPAFDASGNLVDSGNAAGGSAPTVSDQHSNSVPTSTVIAYGGGFVVGGSAGSATVNLVNEISTQAGATYTIGTAAPTTNDAGLILHMTNASPTTITMLAGATLGNGWGITLSCDAGCVINRAGSDTINGLTSMTVAAKQAATLWSDGTSAIVGGILPATDPSNASNLTSGKVPNAQGGAGTLTGVLKATSGVVAQATAGTDYAAATSGSANTPLFNNGSGGFTNGTVSGSGTKVGTVTGSPTNGNCVSWSSGNLADAGGPCTTGGGGGTVSSGTATRVAMYASTGTTVSDDSHLTDDGSILTATQALALSGTLTPTALSGAVNDYNPASLSTALALRIDGGAADRSVTGLAGGVDGRIIAITNIGTTNGLILSNADTGSSAANRFLLPGTITLPPNRSIALRYDGTSSRWRPLSAGGVAVSPPAIAWIAGAVPATMTLFTATQPATVLDITGTVETASGGTTTFSLYKAPSGTACASGTILHSGSFNANSTANTNQTLTLSGTASDLILASGDRVCAVASGAGWTSAHTGSGGITAKVSM